MIYLHFKLIKVAIIHGLFEWAVRQHIAPLGFGRPSPGSRTFSSLPLRLLSTYCPIII